MKGLDALTLGLALAGSDLVVAHGYIQQAVINAKTYLGYNPNTDPYYNPPPSRIFRKIPGNGPVQDLTLNDLQCNGYLNSGSTPAPIFAPVSVGSTMSLNWTTWPDSHKGPILTYMAACQGDCTSYTPGTAKVWFKIAQDGKHSDGSWASDPLITNVSLFAASPSNHSTLPSL